MARGSKIGPAWVGVILTALVLATGIVGGWFILGERQKVHAKELMKHEGQIQANKIECDLKIEEMHKENMAHTKMMTEQNLKQTEAWTGVQTDIKWIKEAIRNGN